MRWKFSLTVREDNFVFHDHRGRRWPAFKFLAVSGSLFAAGALFVFFWSLFAPPPSLNANFSYYFAGRANEGWFPDAATFANQWNAIPDAKLGGIAINRLGFKDPGIWQIIAGG